MPVKPTPYKLVCSKCGFSKMVAPKSDCLSTKDLIEMSPVCPKCKERMNRENLNKLDNLFSIFK